MEAPTVKTAWMFVAALVVAVACVAGTAGAGSRVAVPGHVTIGYQPGIGYAPLIILKQRRTLEKQFPGTTFSWKVLASGAAITNGVISGDLQIGAGGTGPFLVGWAQGVDWKIVAGLDWGDLWLMAKDPAIRTVADLKGKRIAMINKVPGSWKELVFPPVYPTKGS